MSQTTLEDLSFNVVTFLAAIKSVNACVSLKYPWQYILMLSKNKVGKFGKNFVVC